MRATGAPSRHRARPRRPTGPRRTARSPSRNARSPKAVGSCPHAGLARHQRHALRLPSQQHGLPFRHRSRPVVAAAGCDRRGGGNGELAAQESSRSWSAAPAISALGRPPTSSFSMRSQASKASQGRRAVAGEVSAAITRRCATSDNASSASSSQSDRQRIRPVAQASAMSASSASGAAGVRGAAGAGRTSCPAGARRRVSSSSSTPASTSSSPRGRG